MESGILYIIASPIGNMEDITFRAINTLNEKVDLVCCEDTRRTRKLLNNYNINLMTKSLHAHSSDNKIKAMIDLLRKGKSIAYLTDSGTPGLSDPGSRLVSKARAGGIKICPIPGPSALTSIISVSGFSKKNIIFTGFLSKKDNKKRNELIKIKEFEGIIIIYESPYRIKKLLGIISEIFPDNKILIGREMTKFFEEFIFITSKEINDHINTITEKGEFTIAILNNKK